MKYFIALFFCVVAFGVPATVLAQRVFSLHQSDLCFVKNNGQLRDTNGKPCPQIEYVAESNGMRFFFTKQGVSYVLLEKKNAELPNKKRAQDQVLDSEHPAMLGGQILAREIRMHKVDMNILGSSSSVRILPGEQAAHRNHYYTAGTSGGVRNVPVYRTLVYKNVYNNIDLVFYKGKNGLEYDLVVHPGGRVADIRFRYDGAENITLSASGSLRITTSVGVIEEHKPFTYQERETTTATVNGRRLTDKREVASGFQLKNNELRFDVGQFDRNVPLVIDPSIRWSTYLGGSSDDAISDRVIVDPLGYIFVQGVTGSSNFPVSTVEVLKGSTDTFIAKFTKGGQKLWATFFGGNSSESAIGQGQGDIGVDNSGNVFLVGVTASTTGFPVTTGATQTTYGGGVSDVYLAKLDYTGALLWATYYGGNGRDVGSGITLDSEGNVIISGETESNNFPTSTGAYRTSFIGGRSDGFLAKFSGNDGQRLWSTYWGAGSFYYWESAWNVAADNNDDLIVVGFTPGYDLPVSAGAIQTTYGGGIFDAFITKFDKNGNRGWSTYYGGSHTDAAYDVAFDDQNNIIVVGITSSTNFPVSTSAFQSTLPGINNYYDGFVLKLDSSGQRLWATYYGGGTVADVVNGMAIDANDNIWVCGFTESTNFSVTVDAQQSMLKSSRDAFLFKLNSAGQQLYSSYFGGNGSDNGLGIAVDQEGNPILVGYTQSTNLSTSVTAFQPQLSGGIDAFLVKFGPCALPAPAITTPLANPVCPSSSPVILDAGEYNLYRWSNGATTRQIVVTADGVFTVTVEDSEGCSATSAPAVVDIP